MDTAGAIDQLHIGSNKIPGSPTNGFARLIKRLQKEGRIPSSRIHLRLQVRFRPTDVRAPVMRRAVGGAEKALVVLEEALEITLRCSLSDQTHKVLNRTRGYTIGLPINRFGSLKAPATRKAQSHRLPSPCTELLRSPWRDHNTHFCKPDRGYDRRTWRWP